MSSAQQPEWKRPDESKGFISGLRMSNTMTQKKELFIPQEGKNVTWYMCGPTVYDSSHMGHARTYLAFDIIRRILEDYFGYNVFLVMNITDIDDKIILKARQNFLVNEYKVANAKWTDTVAADVVEAINLEIGTFNTKIEKAKTNPKMKSQEKASTIKMFEGKIEVSNKLLESTKALKSGADASQILDDASSALAILLDQRSGDTVDIQRLFREHAERYEKEYLEDMDQLGIRPADVMTRVSEYLDEVVEMVQGIMKNGFAYETDGNVWFDTQAFAAADGHHYAKLKPSSVGDTALLADGEGVLAGDNKKGGKAHPNDFALWKRSKPGEPKWASPWGEGRPGWHIECSAMAGKLLGKTMDIHSGGMDLKFPHHDNEIAQAEAYFPCHQWVNYFLHTGHLHIEGLKMSKSLKNFVTIRQALDDYKPRQLRLLFLFRAWENVMNYSADMMTEIKLKEKYISEFFLLVAQINRDAKLHQQPQRWNENELTFMKVITDNQKEVDEALKDSFDTPRTMAALFNIIAGANTYVRDAGAPEERRVLLVNKAAAFVTRMLKVFGLIGDNESNWSTSSATESTTAIEPIVSVLSSFRAEVRTVARKGKGSDLESAKELFGGLLDQTDELRDSTLPPFGIRLEDDPNFPSAFKMVDPAELMNEIAEKKANARKQMLQKLNNRLQADEKALLKAQKSSLDPEKYFSTGENEGKYGSFGDDGVPLTTADGEEILKGTKKKLAKSFAGHKKAHASWLKQGGEEQNKKLEAKIQATKQSLEKLMKE